MTPYWATFLRGVLFGVLLATSIGLIVVNRFMRRRIREVAELRAKWEALGQQWEDALAAQRHAWVWREVPARRMADADSPPSWPQRES